MEYISVKDYSKKYNISTRRTTLLCSEGRIEGATKISNVWLIPSIAEKPADLRSSVLNEYDKQCETRKTIINCLRSFLNYSRLEVIDNMVSATFDFMLNLFGGKIISKDNHIYHITYNCLNNLHMKNKFIYNNLVSQIYELANKYFDGNVYVDTQFFTEEYMIDYLLNDVTYYENGIFDPCCGGGNFITNYLQRISSNINSTEDIIYELKKVSGYEIDTSLAKVAEKNIIITALQILYRKNIAFSIEDINKIKPNIYISNEYNIAGSLYDELKVKNLGNGEESTIGNLFLKHDALMTNPPFKTKKGMPEELSLFLKEKFENCNSDMCVAFLMKFSKKVEQYNKEAFIVCQNSFLFLNSMYEIRKIILGERTIRSLMNLGSGAFKNLSGEKTSVVLVKLNKNNAKIEYSDLSKKLYKEKISNILSEKPNTIYYKSIFENDYSLFNKKFNDTVSNYAIPMQGTSTGDAKKMIDYFWNHFNDDDWKTVSKGGGYCRWFGLQKYKVKWGHNASYIVKNKGYALRNVDKFDKTTLVYSDTGTAGLNVRVFEDQQIFVASGPGIITNDDDKYSILAYLNSKYATYFLRELCPKFTIAAGYIKQLPINKEIVDSKKIKELAKKCVLIKKKFYSRRPNSYNYNFKADECTTDYVIEFIINELSEEMEKLGYEKEIDKIIAINIPKVEIQERQINNIELIGADRLDDDINEILNSSCEIKRVNSGCNYIGCDGLLEYLSFKYNCSPTSVLKLIKSNIRNLKKTISKYRRLIQCNIVLNGLSYSTSEGFKIRKYMFNYDTNEIKKTMNELFQNSELFAFDEGIIEVL